MEAGTLEMIWLKPIPQKYSWPATALVRKCEIVLFAVICDEKTKKQTVDFLRRVLDEDERVLPSIWNIDLNQEALCDYVLTNIIALLRMGENNCRFFIFLLEHLLYNA